VTTLTTSLSGVVQMMNSDLEGLKQATTFLKFATSAVKIATKLAEIAAPAP
jgi:hypothetical protein